jgi:hypothetical protein
MLIYGWKKNANSGNEVGNFKTIEECKKFARTNIEELQREYVDLNICTDDGIIKKWLIKNGTVLCHEIAFAK